MIRNYMNSKVDIWSEDYINNNVPRNPEHRDAGIVQIEYAHDDMYMVEYVTNKKD